jgi:hypothetical protein
MSSSLSSSGLQKCLASLTSCHHLMKLEVLRGDVVVVPLDDVLMTFAGAERPSDVSLNDSLE